MKYAAMYLDELAMNLNAFKVVDMHDEAQWECDEDQVFFLSDAINHSFDLATEELNLRCPQEPDVKVGMNWMETH